MHASGWHTWHKTAKLNIFIRQINLVSSNYECYFYKVLLGMLLETSFMLLFYTYIFLLLFLLSLKIHKYYKWMTNMNTTFLTFLLCSEHPPTASPLCSCYCWAFHFNDTMIISEDNWRRSQQKEGQPLRASCIRAGLKWWPPELK